MSDDFGIAGKTALVTGSGRNIGRAIVLELAGRGANVIVNARSDKAVADILRGTRRGRDHADRHSLPGHHGLDLVRAAYRVACDLGAHDVGVAVEQRCDAEAS